MARRSGRRPLVPESQQALDLLKAEVMKEKGYAVNPSQPDKVKYEVARSLGIPLNQGYNGQLNTESAGKIGGEIGGSMVRAMVKMAQQQLAQKGKNV
jgi:small acid-soluble spore protein D (minor alpha/beta-type SASP)